MSSEIPAGRRFMELVVNAGEQARRAAHGAGGGRGGEPGRSGTAGRGGAAGGSGTAGGSGAAGRGGGANAPGLASVANEGAATAVDLARQIAGLVLRSAIELGEQLEAVIVGDQPHPGGGDSSSDGGSAGAALALALPSQSPGQPTSASFDVRNDGYDTVDAMDLRCDGLHGTGRAGIPASRIAFTPAVVEVPPRGTTTVTCRVDVPASAARGEYTGLITSDRPGAKLLVTLTVI